jgi:hypothetical protein
MAAIVPETGILSLDGYWRQRKIALYYFGNLSKLISAK